MKMYTLKSISAPRINLSPRFGRRGSGPVTSVQEDEVKSKLVKYSKYKDLSDEELTRKATQLASLVHVRGLIQHFIGASLKAQQKPGNRDGIVLNLRVVDSSENSSASTVLPRSSSLALEIGRKQSRARVSSVLLHWNTAHLVIPYQEKQEVASAGVKSDDTYLVLSFNNSSRTASRLKERGDHKMTSYDLTPFIPASLSTTSLFEKVAEVIVKYNKTYYYHQELRNSQMFVKDTLNAIGLSALVDLDSIIEDFLVGTTGGKHSKPQTASHFDNHEDLDGYVSSLEESGGIEQTSLYELKTLGFWYLKFHVEEAELSTVASHLWFCPRKKCKACAVMHMQTVINASKK